jgi:hypothetical protein
MLQKTSYIGLVSVLSKLIKVYTYSLVDEKVKLRDDLIEKIKKVPKQE